MSTEILPRLPRSFKASELLGGDNHGFLVNAYLALQRQWPDKGGYQHYLHLLATEPRQRLAILHEIAASPSARRHGTELVDDVDAADDLPGGSEQLYLRQCVNLRIPHLALAIDSLRAREDAERANAEIAQLRQRLEEQSREIAGLRRELRNMAARMGLGAVAATQVATLPDEPVAAGPLAAEIEQLKATVGPLHHFATVELKRLFADYVNALLTAHLDAVG